MSHARTHPRRGRSRRRVVTLRLGTERVYREEVHAWGAALVAWRLLRDYQGAFYAEYVADRSATLDLGLGSVAAWFRLVEAQGLALRWPDEDDHDGALLEAVADLCAEECLDALSDTNPFYMASLLYEMEQPRPVYHGYNVQSVLVVDNVSFDDPLALLLWTLFRTSSISVGDPEHMARLSDVPGMLLDQILAVPPLDPETPMETVLTTLAATIPEARTLQRPSDIVRYVFGATGNPLADMGELDLVGVYAGEDDPWGWDEIERLADWQQQAERIAAAYVAWKERIGTSRTALRRLAATIRRIARQARDADEQAGRALIALLAKDEHAVAVEGL